MYILSFVAIFAAVWCSEDKKSGTKSPDTQKSPESRNISPPKGRIEEVKTSFNNKFGSSDRLRKDRSAPDLTVNVKKPIEEEKKTEEKKLPKSSSSADLSINLKKPMSTEKIKPGPALRERDEVTLSPPTIEPEFKMSERKKKGMSWQPPNSRKVKGMSAPANRRPIVKELDLAMVKSETLARNNKVAAAIPEFNSKKEPKPKSNLTSPETRIKSNPTSPEHSKKSSASKSVNSGPSSDEEKRRLAHSGKKQSSKSMVGSVPSGKMKESGRTISKKEKEESELFSVNLSLEFRPKQGSSSSDSSDDSGASESEDKRSLLRKNKKRKAKEPEAEMFYNDMRTPDGMQSKKTITIRGLSGPGGTKQIVGGPSFLPGFPNEGGIMTAIPSGAMFTPPMQPRPRPRGNPYAGSVGNQLRNAQQTLNGEQGGQTHNEGPSAPHNNRPRKRNAPRNQQAHPQQQQQELVQQPGLVYVNVGNQIIAIPTMYNPDEEEAPLNPDEDELESHFLVQALTRTGKGRVIAVNLIRLWRILACLVINVGIFFLMNFLGINNITVNNNSTGP